MNLQHVLGNFWELFREISLVPKQCSLLRAHTLKFSIPEAHRSYPMCDKWDCAIPGVCCWIKWPSPVLSCPVCFDLPLQCPGVLWFLGPGSAWTSGQQEQAVCPQSTPLFLLLVRFSLLDRDFSPPLSVRGANSAVVLILLGPEEVINWSVYSFESWHC